MYNSLPVATGFAPVLQLESAKANNSKKELPKITFLDRNNDDNDFFIICGLGEKEYKIIPVGTIS